MSKVLSPLIVLEPQDLKLLTRKSVDCVACKTMVSILHMAYCPSLIEGRTFSTLRHVLHVGINLVFAGIIIVIIIVSDWCPALPGSFPKVAH